MLRFPGFYASAAFICRQRSTQASTQVKKEFLELYIRYAPLWEKEEGERCQRWSGLLESFAEGTASQSLARYERGCSKASSA